MVLWYIWDYNFLALNKRIRINQPKYNHYLGVVTLKLHIFKGWEVNFSPLIFCKEKQRKSNLSLQLTL